jgi:cyclopropane-fatty-acyl-phospholipid synthase
MRVGAMLAEKGLVPTPLVRRAIRQLCAKRLDEVKDLDGDRFFAAQARDVIAHVPELANAQHYEVPSEFFALVLGRHRKYSSAVWPPGVRTLDEAEEAMLALTCERANLHDGQQVLELGCGWGSLSLFMARRYPASHITAVSNSATQRAYLKSLGLPNLEVRTADMNDFDPGRQFDRIVSVEMFEHMRNWPALLERVSSWVTTEGRIFIHVFSHQSHPYTFDRDGDDNWMGRYFFSGGIMPSRDLMAHALPASLAVEAEWWLDGGHYQRTAAAWRENLDHRRAAVMQILREHYGEADAGVWFHRWRLFFLACEELFGFDEGREWGVAHYRLRPRTPLVEVPA